MRLKKLILTIQVLFTLVIFNGCATNPVTGKSEVALVPATMEISIGEGAYFQNQQSQGGQDMTHPEITAYVSKVGKKLATVCDRPDLPYEFVVLNNSVPNAWSLPGGKIAINRGLLTELESEAELAAVLSHEITHAAARHGAKRVEETAFLQAGLAGLALATKDNRYQNIMVGSAAIGAQLLTFKHSRNAEFEADHYGMKYMSKAGYDLSAAVALQKTFLRLSKEHKPNWLEGLFATHPPSQERIDANIRTAQEYPAGGFIGKDEYLAAIAPLTNAKEAYAAYDRGDQLLNKGQVAEAVLCAQDAIKGEPTEALFYGLLGRAKLKDGKLEEAQEAANEAIRRNGKFFDFYLLRGLVAEKQGDAAAARKDLNQSIALLPTADAHYALGMIALKEGSRDKAIAHFKTASESSSEAGQKAKAELEKIEPKAEGT